MITAIAIAAGIVIARKLRGMPAFGPMFPKKRNHYYEVDIEPATYDALLAWAKGTRTQTPELKKHVKQALEEGRRMDGQLVRAKFDWDKAESEAERRGETLAEWMWDAPWRDAA